MKDTFIIPENILAAIDVAALQGKMQKADWYYEYSDDPGVWRQGRVEIENLKSELEQISRLDGGAETASHLWDAYVPQHSIVKPDCIIIKNEVMDQKNLNYLKDTLKYHGFGEKLFTELEANMKAVNKEFTLSIGTEMKEDKIHATLHFRKSKDTEAYFFNKFEAVLIKPGLEPREQTFYIDKGKGFTMKEAYNYLDGRAVHKEFTNAEQEKYKAWRQIDPEYKDKNNNYEFKQYSERYGYDLREALSYYPIREFVKADDSLNLVKGLERGNLQPVTMDRDGQKLTFEISADPKNRSLNIYDAEGKLLTKTEKEELMLSPEDRAQRIEQRIQLQQEIKVGDAQTAGKENPSVGKEKGEKNGVDKTMEAGKDKVEEKSLASDKVEKKTNGQGKDLLSKKGGNKLLEKKRTGSSKGIKMGG